MIIILSIIAIGITIGIVIMFFLVHYLGKILAEYIRINKEHYLEKILAENIRANKVYENVEARKRFERNREEYDKEVKIAEDIINTTKEFEETCKKIDKRLY